MFGLSLASRLADGYQIDDASTFVKRAGKGPSRGKKTFTKASEERSFEPAVC
jgi:hypothetical protein